MELHELRSSDLREFVITLVFKERIPMMKTVQGFTPIIFSDIFKNLIDNMRPKFAYSTPQSIFTNPPFSVEE